MYFANPVFIGLLILGMALCALFLGFDAFGDD